jgi:alcohol dehydrogenase (NADP+)
LHLDQTTHKNMMAAPKFEGWLGKDEESAQGKMEWGSFEPKKWTEDDVDIEISHCGVCGSDLHMLKSGWAPTPYRELGHASPFTA